MLIFTFPPSFLFAKHWTFTRLDGEYRWKLVSSLATDTQVDLILDFDWTIITYEHFECAPPQSHSQVFCCLFVFPSTLTSIPVSPKAWCCHRHVSFHTSFQLSIQPKKFHYGPIWRFTRTSTCILGFVQIKIQK